MAKKKQPANANKISSAIGFAILGLLLLGFVAYRIAGVSRAEDQPPEVINDQVPTKVKDPVTGIELSTTGIIMISRDGCSWCDKFEQEERPKFESVGYQVEVTKAIKTDQYPKFRIWDGERWSDRTGFFTLQDFRANKAPEIAQEATEAKPGPIVEPKPEPLVATKPEAKAAAPKQKTKAVDPVSGFIVYGPTVIILSADGCAPCLIWDRTKGAVLRSKDVEVFAIKTVRKPSYPAFRIFDGKNWHDRAGSRTTAEEILSLISGP